MIKIFSFEPMYFDNNGDQGNVEILLHQLSQQGKKFKIVASAEKADFVLIGDASNAVMDRYAKDLAKLRKTIAQRFTQGSPTLLVGSAYEFFAAEMGLSSNVVTRESKFVTTSEGYFGYRNSDKDLPVCFVNGSFIGTSLFGPVLAKNPRLLERVLNAVGAELKLSAQAREWIEIIRSKNG